MGKSKVEKAAERLQAAIDKGDTAAGNQAALDVFKADPTLLTDFIKDTERNR